MATFVGGAGSPFLNSGTAAPGLAAPATGAAAPAPSAPDMPIAHGGAAPAAPGPFVGGAGSPAAPSSAAQSFEGLGSSAPSSAAAPAANSWFAPATHLDTAGIQWFANSSQADTFGTPTMHMGAPAITEGIGIGAMTLGSVFPSASDHGWGGAGDGSFMVSELPFTHETSFDDTPIYTASADTPWVFVSDFSGDGWFFV